MPDIKIEDSVLLIDSSRSMLRADIKPSRLQVVMRAVKGFIESKSSIDPKDRISIITFGKLVKKIAPFSNEPEMLINALNRLEISGKGRIFDGIAYSLQMIIQEMRKIGGKIFRIIILSDNKVISKEGKLINMVNLLKGLGIIVDVYQLSLNRGKDYESLKQIAEATKGKFGHFATSKLFLSAVKELASKKDLGSGRDYYSEKKKDLSPLLSEIALPMRRPNVFSVRSMIREEDDESLKCQICHSKKSPLTHSDFYTEGRYCPSCERAMHLSCATMWAQKSEKKRSIFRCPFCYFLLEIPKSSMKIIENKVELVKQKDQKASLIMTNETKMKLVPAKNMAVVYASCNYCNNIFTGEYKVFQCENCKSYYHEPCLHEVYEQFKACRFCGYKIVF